MKCCDQERTYPLGSNRDGARRLGLAATIGVRDSGLVRVESIQVVGRGMQNSVKLRNELTPDLRQEMVSAWGRGCHGQNCLKAILKVNHKLLYWKCSCVEAVFIVENYLIRVLNWSTK